MTPAAVIPAAPPAPTPTGAQPILLDTGPSKAGAHRLQAVLTCPALYGFTKRFTGSAPTPAVSSNRDPLVRGSMGHVALAHHYARLGCEQNGKDSNTYYPPHAAIDLIAAKFGAQGEKFRDLIHTVYDRYAGFYAVERQRIVAVEYPVEVQIPDPGRPGVTHLFTQRWDLVTQDSAGRFWITDHKFVADVSPGTLQRYALSIQFVSMRWLGAKVFGSAFGGVLVSLVGVREPPSFLRKPPPPAPDAIARFPETLARAESLIASLAPLDVWDYPRVYSETTCMTAYGPCPAFDLCCYGKSTPWG